MSIWTAAPFVLLLAAIAVAPLVDGRWWGRFYPAVSLGLAGVTALAFLLTTGTLEPILGSLEEYVSFIALIGSLYVITGGLHIRLRGRSTPITNVAFLALGAVIANLVGTTGASMILIRPFIHVNRYRIKPFHVVFFIFIVSNIGGAVTPVGDPPLFIGYLRGVPFFWPVENLWPIWALAVGLVLGVFYLLDRRDYVHLPKSQQERTQELPERGEVIGWHNVIFLVIVLAAVFVTHPPFVREALMIAAAAGSYYTTKPEIFRKNAFSFGPVREVAILFLGIFVTMVPALIWIKDHAAGFGIAQAGHFFWTTGALSSVLDNAPTYLNFLSAAIGQFVPPGTVEQVQTFLMVHGTNALGAGSPDVVSTAGVLAQLHPEITAGGAVSPELIATAHLIATHAVVLKAISAGAVFFGAMTYIGNGPNLMVKSIAEHAGLKCPTFGAYVIRFAVPVLIPAFLVIWFVFFR